MHLKGTDSHSEIFSSLNSIFANRKGKFLFFLLVLIVYSGFMMATGVDAVHIDFEKPTQRSIASAHPKSLLEMRERCSRERSQPTARLLGTRTTSQRSIMQCVTPTVSACTRHTAGMVSRSRSNGSNATIIAKGASS